MTRSWNTIIVLVIFFSSSLVSNNAAPASKPTEAITSTGNGDPQPELTGVDEEVLELEHLKHPPVTAATPPVSSGANTKEEILPQLEKQLEEEAQASASITSSDEDDAAGDDVDDSDDDDGDDDADADENDDSNDYAEKLAKASESMLLKTLAEYHHKQQEQDQTTTDDNSKLMKLLPGAARLTFGQHYGSDSTTTPTIPKSSVTTTTTTTTASSQPEEVPNNELEFGSESATQSAQRRGDNAEALLRHSGGQYSAFDMAQYVFWTGDEAGVARAVEELIQKGLMTRENAIKFLRDIRLGIDYLQNTYSNRPFKSARHVKNEDGSTVGSPAEEITTTTTVAPPTEAVMTNVETTQQVTLAPEILKVIERLPSLLKLNELSEQTESTQDYDDVVGRLRLADFLYAEYSLEEVIYQLAKVMFVQSLTQGSEPAQHALQKLTEFLESEGVHGRISPTLQKKILDVLLAALADTLAENPELMKAARSALGKHMEKIPQRYTQNQH
ncbi:uncharacterized protein LOC120426424 isoform X1 [Culex pipiens pallens]|uniref:uncharacterized protein LOC120426424 isoform X1 n=1 Tax=Culex pipiens pallens TaxID=42434 RepID=UPI0019533620|nr:uncharacterized protein LOC120426424 isoform X1 [Culex pipiens pallens]XP_039447117.1 uncharacterized protein LOC120426424 isoform X1 [Culex pipiens pallens]XP_039447118.1 uncharacterized protein LOC120426424 isoform X1 [Culex pipiens pallens]XP_039447120.1 uncharacterized protein LOC120426424 isoform X1 [Culex pipiens pallens]